MRYILVAALVLAAGASASISGSTISSYLDSLEANYEVSESGLEFILINQNEQGDQWPFMYIGIDQEADACYMEALTPTVIPASGAARTEALETLTEMNWNYPFTKFAVNPESNEVSATYVFSTEDGIGFNAFAAMIYVLVGTVQDAIDDLEAISVEPAAQ